MGHCDFLKITSRATVRSYNDAGTAYLRYVLYDGIVSRVTFIIVQ